MLEIRYVKNTGTLMAWASSPGFTGGNLEPKEGQEITVIDCPTPAKPMGAYLYNEEAQALIPNPDYIPPAGDYDTTPDYLRACELLAQSPPVITMPAIWELLRIIGKRLGYHFD